MQFNDAFLSLFEVGFLGFAGNEHTVKLPSGASCGHQYCWHKLRDADLVMVDLLLPQEGVAYDAATHAEMDRWNATQVARGKQKAAALGAPPRNQSLVMQGDEPFVTIESQQFQLLPGNDHTVELSPGAQCYRHAYYWRDLQEAGVTVVDLLQPQEGVVYDADSQMVMERWNAAQVARAKEQVTISRELQRVLSVCS
jgi:hypothetical protein